MTHHFFAGMAELADALDLGSSVPDVRVQVSLSAPRSKKVNLAGIAQLVEHNLAKVRVASSSLVFRSKEGEFPSHRESVTS